MQIDLFNKINKKIKIKIQIYWLQFQVSSLVEELEEKINFKTNKIKNYQNKLMKIIDFKMILMSYKTRKLLIQVP